MQSVTSRPTAVKDLLPSSGFSFNCFAQTFSELLGKATWLGGKLEDPSDLFHRPLGHQRVSLPLGMLKDSSGISLGETDWVVKVFIPLLPWRHPVILVQMVTANMIVCRAYFMDKVLSSCSKRHNFSVSLSHKGSLRKCLKTWHLNVDIYYLRSQ